MRFYLASRWDRQAELRGYREQLRSLGHEATSRWLDVVYGAVRAELTAEEKHNYADQDLCDILYADAIICFTEKPGDPIGGRGGRHIEAGFAMGNQMPVIAIGYRENLFYHHRSVIFYSTWDGAVAAKFWEAL